MLWEETTQRGQPASDYRATAALTATTTTAPTPQPSGAAAEPASRNSAVAPSCTVSYTPLEPLHTPLHNTLHSQRECSFSKCVPQSRGARSVRLSSKNAVAPATDTRPRASTPGVAQTVAPATRTTATDLSVAVAAAAIPSDAGSLRRRVFAAVEVSVLGDRMDHARLLVGRHLRRRWRGCRVSDL